MKVWYENILSIEKTRYKWVDVLKFLGIFAVYLGHFGDLAGKLYPFVFCYHVPLFFFVSGFFASVPNNHFKLFKSLKKHFFSLIVPYFSFAVFGIIVALLEQSSGIYSLLSMIKQSLFGIRNQIIFAGALWFLPCLFLVSVFYDIISFVFRNYKNVIWITFLVAMCLYVVTQTLLPNNPIIYPSLFFNIDSAMYYMIYYVLGAILFPLIKNANFKGLTINGRIFVCFMAFASFIIAAVVYFKGSGFILEKLPFEVPFMVKFIFPLLITMTIIFVNIIFSFLLQKISLLSDMGKNTIIFCGTESIVKVTILRILEIFGMYGHLSTTYSTVLYTFLILFLSHKFLVPFLDKYFPFFRNGKLNIELLCADIEVGVSSH